MKPGLWQNTRHQEMLWENILTTLDLEKKEVREVELKILGKKNSFKISAKISKIIVKRESSKSWERLLVC